ncbi:MAG: alkaline phosphatase D family protein, partial [Cyanobacteriota bacterium]|nr:alkaline phosphatase D family protein [Cyanobacteriota bacterium]
RPPELDNNEIILVELPEPLDLDPLLGVNGLIPEVNTLPNGVASGDTTQDSTVLWARSLAEGEITFEYSTDADFNSLVGTVTATVEETNIPVKVEVTELEAGTDYYYRVTDAAGTTAEGIFETAAEMGTQAGLSFGVTGDWRGELAPYPAITNVAEQELDFFVEHGDTIYADIASPAVLNPDGTRKEQAETLDEYRAKHNEVYSERLGLNAWADVRSSTSILATIDDHEVINDFAGGAPASSDERFPETEGLINDTELFENGLQTFQEYNPLRDDFYGETGEERSEGERKLYRYNTYGSDTAVMVLDTRSFRDAALPGPEDFTNPEDVAEVLTATLTEDITMLGEVQLEDLKQDLVAADEAGITWKFVMVPEPMQNIFPGVNTDAFEGYGKERTEILKFITENEIDNVVFVAADVHTTFVNNITYQEEPFGEQIPTNIFGVTTGAVAFDAPTGEFLGDLFVSGNPDAEALYNSLPIAPDTDDIPDDKDDFVEQAINSTLLEPFGFDPLGLDNNLPQAEGLIDAELLQGDYFVGHTYGWTQFDIDSETQELTVTTYGIEAYTEDELLENTEEVLSREPEIVSQFVVNPVADDNRLEIEGTDENNTLTGAENDNIIAGLLGNDLINGGDGDDVLRGDFNSRDSGGFVGGNDTINGGLGNDQIGGKAGDDILNGDEGNDSIWGDDGDDLIRGGLGNDILTGDDFSGGQGSDVFVLAIGEGTDTITDFEVGVDLIGLAEGLTFAELSISGNTIAVGDEILATVLEVTELSESDFFTL